MQDDEERDTELGRTAPSDDPSEGAYEELVNELLSEDTSPAEGDVVVRVPSSKNHYFETAYYTPLWLSALKEDCPPEAKAAIRDEIVLASQDIARAIIHMSKLTQFATEEELLQEAAFKVVRDFEKFNRNWNSTGKKLSAFVYLTTIIKHHLLTHVYKRRRLAGRWVAIEFTDQEGNTVNYVEIRSPKPDWDGEMIRRLDPGPEDRMRRILYAEPLGRKVLVFLRLRELGLYKPPEPEGQPPQTDVSTDKRKEKKTNLRMLFRYLKDEGAQPAEVKAMFRKVKGIYLSEK